MKIKNLIFLILIFSGCAKSLIPVPSYALPEININPSPSASYGVYPENYQIILQDFLKTKFKDSSKVKVEFVSKPEKLSVSTMRDEFNGYRVCLSIFDEGDTKNKTYKNHFFLINNGKVITHLYDSGLLKLPFELCVSRTSANYQYLDDIEKTPEPTSIEEMDDPDSIEPREKIEEYQKPKSNIFISCVIKENEYTYVFNEFNQNFPNFLNNHIFSIGGNNEMRQ